ncbi:MAG: immunoglobulin-like domain-containing protein, partial [Candidatus Puniceispirillaceae bacterium]
VDGTVSVDTDNAVGTAAGTYSVTYTAEDSAGNIATLVRTVIVADPVRDSFVEAEIVSPHMYDPSGDRQNG